MGAETLSLSTRSLTEGETFDKVEIAVARERLADERRADHFAIALHQAALRLAPLSVVAST